MRQRLAELAARYAALTEQLTRPEVLADPGQIRRLSREQAELEPVVQLWHELQRVERDLAAARELLADGTDEELRALAREEAEALEQRQAWLVEQALEALRPRDPNDTRDVIVEIRAGTGGEEASLFAADLFRMYLRYAESKRWKVEVLNSNQTDLGGYREVIFEVAGRGAFSRLKYERGVHRVQRVPITEASGRIHTSTATVAVLPKVDEVEVQLNEEDLRIDVFRSSGHGGQSVNTTDSAVRITHLPTGLVVTCQDGKSQLKNKEKALSVLRARLFDLEQRRHLQEIGERRRMLIGSGDRNERVRTYNFPQDRLTDERLDQNFHNLLAIMDGDLDDLFQALATADRAEQLAA